jgi:cell wall-associated NlpC family hydrolase
MSLYADLIGRPGMDCWVLAHTVLYRMGIHVPSDQTRALAGEHALGVELEHGEEPAAGCLVVMVGPQGPHVGVMVDARTMIHAMPDAVRIDRLATWQRAGRVQRILKARSQ